MWLGGCPHRRAPPTFLSGAGRDEGVFIMEALLLLLALAPPLMVGYATKQSIPLNFGSEWIGLSTFLLMDIIIFLSISGTFYRPVGAFPMLTYGLALAVLVITALILFTTFATNEGGLRNIGLGVLGAAAYSCGAIYFLNGFLSLSPPRRVQATIVDRHYHSGRRSKFYNFRLSSPDPEIGDGEWKVSYADFNALNSGSVACVDLYDGGLGAKWYRAGACPNQSSKPIQWYGLSDWISYGSGSFELYNSSSK